MSDIGPGDVVVCLGDSLGPGDNVFTGKLYRVSQVIECEATGQMGLLFYGLKPHPFDAWNSVYFRKVRPADESFTRTIRACRPKTRERERV